MRVSKLGLASLVEQGEGSFMLLAVRVVNDSVVVLKGLRLDVETARCTRSDAMHAKGNRGVDRLRAETVDGGDDGEVGVEVFCGGNEGLLRVEGA